MRVRFVEAVGSGGACHSIAGPPHGTARVNARDPLVGHKPLGKHPPIKGNGPLRDFSHQSSPRSYFTVTVKQPVRISLVGLVRLSTSRNITSNCVPSTMAGAAKSM
jgi:hypothetical protein